MTERAHEVEMMRRFIASSRRKRAAELSWRLHRARGEFCRIVEMIVSEFDPVRIYQWGSLVDGAVFQEISDIDIAAEGVTDAAEFLRLRNRAAELTSFPLDIVQIETVHPEHARNIIRKGVLVYERPV